jgi:Immunity protein 74
VDPILAFADHAFPRDRSFPKQLLSMAKRRDQEPKITLTEGSVRVRRGEKTLTLLPLPNLPNAEDPPDFIIDLDAILCWDEPYEAIEIEIDELGHIVHAIEEEFERLGLKVEFE